MVVEPKFGSFPINRLALSTIWNKIVRVYRLTNTAMHPAKRLSAIILATILV